MNGRQFIYHMQGLTKTYPPAKKVLDNVHLSFYPDAKIGVLGVNGSGKSTLLRIMAGIDTEFTGEAWVAEGARVGYLEQEPQLDPKKTVRENVMEGVAAKKAVLDRYNEIAANYSDETADEMAKLQDEIDSKNLWDLDSQVDLAMDALRCPADDADVTKLSGGERRRVALCKLLLDQPDLLLEDARTITSLAKLASFRPPEIGFPSSADLPSSARQQTTLPWRPAKLGSLRAALGEWPSFWHLAGLQPPSAPSSPGAWRGGRDPPDARIALARRLQASVGRQAAPSALALLALGVGLPVHLAWRWARPRSHRPAGRRCSFGRTGSAAIVLGLLAKPGQQLLRLPALNKGLSPRRPSTPRRSLTAGLRLLAGSG